MGGFIIEEKDEVGEHLYYVRLKKSAFGFGQGVYPLFWGNDNRKVPFTGMGLWRAKMRCFGATGQEKGGHWR